MKSNFDIIKNNVGLFTEKVQTSHEENINLVLGWESLKILENFQNDL